MHDKIKVVRRPPRQIRPRSYYSFLRRRSRPTSFLDSTLTKKLHDSTYKGKNNDHTYKGKNNDNTNYKSNNKLKSGQNSQNSTVNINDDDDDDTNDEGENENIQNLLTTNDSSDSDHELIGLTNGINTHKKEP